MEDISGKRIRIFMNVTEPDVRGCCGPLAFH
jgi:hypothetical protein